jgi:hypothetical protein
MAVAKPAYTTSASARSKELNIGAPARSLARGNKSQALKWSRVVNK